MKADTIKNFGTACETYNKARNEVREVCLNMLKEICNRREDKTISLVNMNKWLLDYGLDVPFITYDGGNHPEYASNLYSAVEGFRLDFESGDIIFEIEDASNYDEDRVMTSELIYLCDMFIEYETNGDGWQLGVNEYDEDDD